MAISPKTLAVLRKLGFAQDCNQVIDSVGECEKRKQKRIRFGDPIEMAEIQRARLTLDAFDQASIRRSVNLIQGFLQLVGRGNTHSLALLGRGHLETTAQYGYLCDALNALKERHISFESFHDKLATLMLGHSGPDLELAMKPINVMTILQKADRFRKKIGFVSGEDTVLEEMYGWLSNFGHPNFLSNSSTFRIESDKGDFVFDDGVRNHDKELFNYLIMSCQMQSGFVSALIDLKETLSD